MAPINTSKNRRAYSYATEWQHADLNFQSVTENDLTFMQSDALDVLGMDSLNVYIENAENVVLIIRDVEASNALDKVAFQHFATGQKPKLSVDLNASAHRTVRLLVGATATVTDGELVASANPGAFTAFARVSQSD